jgi:hypothetical protein
MPKFRVTFKSGESVEKTANTAAEAKQAAKLEAQRQTGAVEARDPRVAVAGVEEIASS